jgi:type I restriction enzyme S subunit
MELKAGYKSTDFGVIPQEWKVKRLGELASVSSGGTPSRSNPRYWNGDIPWITTSELDFHTITEVKQFITKEGLENSAARLLPPGTLLMALYGQGKTRGKISMLGTQASTNQACAAISLHGTVSREYMFHFLASKYESIRNLSNTGNQENLSSSLVRSIPVLLPPEVEQQAIAAALSDADALLDALTKLIAKKRDLKQVAMQQLLTGHRRLHGFKGEWDLVPLGELFTFKNGLNKGKEFFGHGTPIVNYMDVYGHPGLHRNDLHGMVSLTNQERKTFDVRRGDVFFTRTSETVEEVGIAAVMLDGPEETVFSGFLLRARPKNGGLCNAFKKYCFASHAIRTQIVSRASYTTRALTNGRFLSLVSLQRPPLAEQTAISTVLSDMDAEIKVLEQRRNKTRALKQGMMQALLTGRTRLV